MPSMNGWPAASARAARPAPRAKMAMNRCRASCVMERSALRPRAEGVDQDVELRLAVGPDQALRHAFQARSGSATDWRSVRVAGWPRPVTLTRLPEPTASSDGQDASHWLASKWTFGDLAVGVGQGDVGRAGCVGPIERQLARVGDADIARSGRDRPARRCACRRREPPQGGPAGRWCRRCGPRRRGSRRWRRR